MEKLCDRGGTEYFLLLLLLCVALFLFLGNLGNQYLWQDEAQTALISKTIFTHYVPLGYDGRNYFSQEMGAEYGKNYVWKWHTWLQFYVLALFFKLFGVNTFVARLPFALFGIASVFMTYAFCKELWEDRKIAFTAAFLLLISVPFLLLSRQCRYYSMTAFFSLAGLYAYLGLMENKKHFFVAFVLSLTLLFHTHYIYSATLLITVCLHAFFFHRNRLRVLLWSVAFILLLNIPWIIWLSGMRYGETYGSVLFQTKKLVMFAKSYMYQLCQYVFTPYMFLLIPLIVIANRIRTGSFFPNDRVFWQRLLLLLFFILINVVTLTIASPWPFFRYLAPLVPITIVLAALLVVVTVRIHWALSAGIVVVLIFTGSLGDFLYELTHDYNGPIEGIVKYLNENGSKDDVVAVTYGDMPLKFYTGMRVIGGCTGEDLFPAKQAKWVILRKYTLSKKDANVRKWLIRNIQWENYRKIVINYPDIPWENREEPAEHNFRTVTNEDRVVIFHKIR